MEDAFDRRAARRWKMLTAAGLSVSGYGFAVAYCLITWSEANRPAMLVAYGFGLALGAVSIGVALRGVSSRVAYGFSLVMPVTAIIVVTLCAYWDGGADSPVALGFIITALFAASATARLALMLGLETAIIAAYLLVAVVGEPVPAGSLLLHIGSMLGVIGVCAIQTRALARQRAQLRELAERDPLTGALNRRGLARWSQGRPVVPSAICLDLDGFKAVNDTLGHAAGDELLQWVVRVVRGVLGPADVIARIGGDEFVIGLAQADERATRAMTERVCGLLRRRTGVSAGWACAPRDGDSFDCLTRAADQRLYRHKHGGRGVPTPLPVRPQRLRQGDEAESARP